MKSPIRNTEPLIVKYHAEKSGNSSKCRDDRGDDVFDQGLNHRPECRADQHRGTARFDNIPAKVRTS